MRITGRLQKGTSPLRSHPSSLPPVLLDAAAPSTLLFFFSIPSDAAATFHPASILPLSCTSPCSAKYIALFCKFITVSTTPPRYHMAAFTASSQTAAILPTAGH
ncbi:hypothetical protein NL676_018118 [Syzygium grande]|nr:hypothetical protein NL676_018118 [Syzygium grande]